MLLVIRKAKWIALEDAVMKGALAPAPFNRGVRAVSILFGAAPFAFAAIRAATTGNDFRYMWVALAAFCGAAAVMGLARARVRTPYAAVAASAAAFACATTLAVIAALVLGTRLGPGILVVAAAFGGCLAIACLLRLVMRDSIGANERG
jgi:hypothetical protein